MSAADGMGSGAEKSTLLASARRPEANAVGRDVSESMSSLPCARSCRSAIDVAAADAAAPSDSPSDLRFRAPVYTAVGGGTRSSLADAGGSGMRTDELFADARTCCSGALSDSEAST
jgi:hypothetical protein